MRIAWFRHASLDLTDPLDDSASLISELRASHDVDVVTETSAHDFVWQQFHRPWDLCVYELDHTREHEFVWAYLVNYPGIVMLRSTDVPNLRVPLFASRCVVTSTAANAELLRALFPEARVRVAPRCGRLISSVPLAESGARPATSGADSIPSGGDPIPSADSIPSADPLGPRSVRFAVFDDRGRGADVVDRAMQRARDAGASFEIVAPDSDANMLLVCDVVIAPGWPPFHLASTAVLAGMAAGKTVVTMEMDATSEWPALDPQTWQPRGIAVSEPPIVVTIDPRDEEHSLMLAIRRLSSDAALRGQLGSAGHTWWKGHATPAHAAAAWRQIIEEAVTLSPPPRPADWPKQFASDGTELAREILSEFGLPTASLWDLGQTGSPTDTPARS